MQGNDNPHVLGNIRRMQTVRPAASKRALCISIAYSLHLVALPGDASTVHLCAHIVRKAFALLYTCLCTLEKSESRPPSPPLFRYPFKAIVPDCLRHALREHAAEIQSRRESPAPWVAQHSCRAQRRVATRKLRAASS